jgi:hypothetical protein
MRAAGACHTVCVVAAPSTASRACQEALPLCRPLPRHPSCPPPTPSITTTTTATTTTPALPAQPSPDPAEPPTLHAHAPLPHPPRGYAEDACIERAALPEREEGQAYRVWHWSAVDTFVYFSHHLVTIPPRGWTEAAHRHSTRVRASGGAGAGS